MSDLIERLQAWGDLDTEHGHNSRADILHRAARRITALEASLAEAEGRVIAEVVAWLRKEAGDPDDFATYAATALETGEWKK